MQLIVLRHAATHWNIDRRIQGRADPPLAEAGRAQVATWQVPPAWRQLRCFVSPLRRTLETASLLGFANLTIAPALIEMNWGAFEGSRLAELRARGGSEFAANEASGLDFRPLGGESPREVMARLSPWLAGLSDPQHEALVVTHKGVRRALLALATAWDMRGPPPIKLRDEQAMLLKLDPDGVARLHGIQSLEPSS